MPDARGGLDLPGSSGGFYNSNLNPVATPLYNSKPIRREVMPEIRMDSLMSLAMNGASLSETIRGRAPDEGTGP
jgi:hypothetical protein